MRFVANKLSTAAKRGQLVLSGVFQYSILSLLNRQEWVAAKAIQLLDEAGHDNDWLYDNAAIKGKGTFEYYVRKCGRVGGSKKAQKLRKAKELCLSTLW